ncbi:MAG: DUF1579 domain-containing protein [Sphingobium sp.]|uniref:DUF1579 domain-containing protein n=1 Tax=Sphingobium sp. TaxID=1912891 RepID=UPI003BAFD301
MTMVLDRRNLLQATAAALAFATASRGADARSAMSNGPGSHDFDFFFGVWTVAHRKLKIRMVGSRDWETFSGDTTCRPLMNGLANYNDSVSHHAGQVGRGVGIRAFNAADGTWADWYLSGGAPSSIDTPGIGRFAGGVGTFLSDDVFQGRPIKVRGIFTDIRPGLAQWEQAFSADEGRSWETNWIMQYTRVRELPAET